MLLLPNLKLRLQDEARKVACFIIAVSFAHKASQVGAKNDRP